MEYLKEWELEYNREHFNVSRYADIKMQATELGFSRSVDFEYPEIEYPENLKKEYLESLFLGNN